MNAIDWTSITGSVLDQGFATTPQLLSPEECRTLVAQYHVDANFRTTITMERFNFGRGEYKYFAYPLPAIVQNLRQELYPRLAAAANTWGGRLGIKQRYPSRLEEFLRECKRRHQVRPTPLMLKYQEGDFNCLHQDLYGDLFFPFQAVFGLSRPGTDYLGGELVLVKQRPRMQSIPQVIDLPQGHGIIFCVNFHPQQGKKGWFRTVIKHGVSRVARGKRFTLGIIFHDAK
jgi:hypothetical protein